jgi:hypothetical protein
MRPLTASLIRIPALQKAMVAVCYEIVSRSLTLNNLRMCDASVYGHWQCKGFIAASTYVQLQNTSLWKSKISRIGEAYRLISPGKNIEPSTNLTRNRPE